MRLCVAVARDSGYEGTMPGDPFFGDPFVGGEVGCGKGCGTGGSGDGGTIGFSIGADSFVGVGVAAGAGAAGAGGLNCILRKMICWRRSNRLVGCAGLCTRGLMIAPAISAACS
jgi:hypothetical protein